MVSPQNRGANSARYAEIMPPQDRHSSRTPALGAGASTGTEWWRTAVIYQVYPRSFADESGDGIGDLAGVTRRLPELVELGVDAIWLSPFFTSPQHDAGYDVADYRDVDPRFGTLADWDALQDAAHAAGLKVLVDLVPNHSSSDHTWFQEALASPPGSAERARYIFRDGRGEHGELPPNNWQSVFGGGMWTRITEADGAPGQWYLHIFDETQPDFDWQNPWVREQFRGILRFWLDRGADGFRVDVAHGLIKAPGLPDAEVAESGSFDEAMSGQGGATAPYWGQDGVHEIYRDWHAVLAEYPGDRAMVAEAWVEPLTKLARWVRDDEMSQAFNFPYLETPWEASALRHTIDDSLGAFDGVGAPSTWVLSNHDVVRHATRLALDERDLHAIGPDHGVRPDRALGLRKARAATTVMLALPGSAYLYQGEELGLYEVLDLPDDARQDPAWFRSGRTRYGRDGCRVPLPWNADAPAFGFSSEGESWLPQPADWGSLARDAQRGTSGSTLELYRTLLALRREYALGEGMLEWADDSSGDVLIFRTGHVTVVANTGSEVATLPAGEVLTASGPIEGGILPTDTTVWMRVA